MLIQLIFPYYSGNLRQQFYLLYFRNRIFQDQTKKQIFNNNFFFFLNGNLSQGLFRIFLLFSENFKLSVHVNTGCHACPDYYQIHINVCSQFSLMLHIYKLLFTETTKLLANNNHNGNSIH